ncbi:hypothetical protein [Streptomyces griseosporeus]|uniref:hypothetical protein n=1 Tax=Streptomyces griseosporeus TaxID=1910 RepID=UPI0036FB9F1D
MRVVVRQAFKAYIHMQPEDFTPGQTIKGDTAAHLLRAGAAVDPDDDDARALAEQLHADDDQAHGQDEGQGPKGTDGPEDELDINASVPDILTWVGDDPERAAEALRLEQAKDKPRSTLVTQLTKTAEA